MGHEGAFDATSPDEWLVSVGIGRQFLLRGICCYFCCESGFVTDIHSAVPSQYHHSPSQTNVAMPRWSKFYELTMQKPHCGRLAVCELLQAALRILFPVRV